MPNIEISVEKRVWPLRMPFAVTGHTWHEIELVFVQARSGQHSGQAEGAPLFYRQESADALVDSIAQLLPLQHEPWTRDLVAELSLPSGARNALDCALWDLECKSTGKSITELAKLDPPRPLETMVTVPLNSPGRLRAQAATFSSYPILKVKLDNNEPAACLEAIRQAAPRARLVVDANCAWSIDELVNLESALIGADVEMVEQPLAPDHDAALAGYRPPYKLCADESCQTIDSLPAIVDRYDMINIKLDKAGGFTASLALAKEAKKQGLELMVGNMLGSSLAMAPAYYVGVACTYVDIDGPVYLTHDCEHGFKIEKGVVSPPGSALWG